MTNDASNAKLHIDPPAAFDVLDHVEDINLEGIVTLLAGLEKQDEQQDTNL